MVESRLQAKMLKTIREYGLMARAVEWRGQNDCPDIVIINPPTLWIEIKTPLGKVRPGQRREHNKMLSHGANVHVLRSEKALIALIQQFYPAAERRD